MFKQRQRAEQHHLSLQVREIILAKQKGLDYTEKFDNPDEIPTDADFVMEEQPVEDVEDDEPVATRRFDAK